MRILLVEDQDIVRRALKLLLLSQFRDLDIRDVANCDEAEKLQGESFDVILLDLHLPGVTGMDGIAKMLAAFAPTRIVVLSADQDPDQVRRAIKAGALGYIRKSDDPDILEPALRLVLAGGIYIPPAVLGNMEMAAPAGLAPTNPENEPELLTNRQRAVLEKAFEGKPNKVIARELGISASTVKAHLSSSFRALGVSNRTGAVFALARKDMRSKLQN